MLITKGAKYLYAVVVVIAGFSAVAAAGESKPAPLFSLSDVVPDGGSRLEFMKIKLSDRANELGLKLQAAAAANREWFLEQVKRAQPGKPLDYDPRLGLTKEEYAEYLQEADKRQLVSTGVIAKCTFRRDGDVVSLDIPGDKSPLHDLRLNVVSGVLSTSVGNMGTGIWSSSEDAKGALGAFDECKWRYEKTDAAMDNVRVMTLGIFRLKPSGRVLWRLQDSEIRDGELKSSFEVIFQYSR